jgi:hypothetical protein
MEADFEERLNHLRDNYLDFFTPENKVALKRLLTQVKDAAKIAKVKLLLHRSHHQSRKAITNLWCNKSAPWSEK